MEESQQQDQSQQSDELKQLGQVIGSIQNSIGSITSNLATAYQKMAQNMESSIQMMSSMNKMMEAMVLQNLVIIPIINKENDQSIQFVVTIQNQNSFPLQGLKVSIHLNEESSTTENQLPESFSNSEIFSIEASSQKKLQFDCPIQTHGIFDIQLSFPSPGTGEEISKTSYHAYLLQFFVSYKK